MPLSILLTCDEEYQPAVRDLSSFLWDMTMLHDRLFIFFHSPSDYILYSTDFYRRWRRLPADFELRFGKLSRRSPIEIELIVATIGSIFLAAKTFAEILHIIHNWQYEQEKQKLEIFRNRIEILKNIEGLREASPELLRLLDKDIHRLFGNPIRISKVEERELREG